MELLSGTVVKGGVQVLAIHNQHGGSLFFCNGKGTSIKSNLHPPKLNFKGNAISHKNYPGFVMIEPALHLRSSDNNSVRGPLYKWRNFQLRVTCLDHNLTKETDENAVPNASVSVILLSGGKGKRMGASMPKQYLPLLGQPIALYSFLTFCEMPEVKEIVVVCDPTYRDIFQGAHKQNPLVTMKFASPGKERQDSVFNGLKEIDIEANLVCVHDSARPLVRKEDIQNVLKSGRIHGAAVLGVPVKATIKEAGKDGFVTKTLDRSSLWEMQTPQVIEPSLLRDGFELVHEKNLAVTDDVSIVEHLKHPVFITEGSYTNIKITTPDDMLVAENVLNQSYGDLAAVVV